MGNICDGACKCSECIYNQRDTERDRMACFAKPDRFGYVHAKRKGSGTGNFLLDELALPAEMVTKENLMRYHKSSSGIRLTPAVRATMDVWLISKVMGDLRIALALHKSFCQKISGTMPYIMDRFIRALPNYKAYNLFLNLSYADELGLTAAEITHINR